LQNNKKTRTLFQFLLIAFSVLSMLLGSSVIHGGVAASMIPASNPEDIPPPNPTITSVCNPYVIWLAESDYTVQISSPQVDKLKYHPGDVVTITGTVQLQRTDILVNDCGEISEQSPASDDAGKVKMGITGPYGGVITNTGGSFTAKVNVPADADSGTVTYTITASYSSSRKSSEVQFQVETYTPSLSIEMTHGSFAYPGEACKVSGSGWMPNGQVTLSYGKLGTGPPVTVSGSGDFTAPSMTVPQDSDETSYPITGTEQPNLNAGGVACVVKWHQLVIATLNISPASVQQGTSVAITGSVTDDEGKPVAQAAVSFSVNGGKLSTPSTATTDGSGQFTSSLTVDDNATATSYTILASAQKTGGYRSGSKDGHLIVTVRPPSPSLTGVVVSAVGALVGIAGAALTGGLWGRLGDSRDHPFMGDMAQMQAQMLADMQQQNMQNFMFQQEVNRQSQQFATLSNAQKAMHDSIMAMLNNAK